MGATRTLSYLSVCLTFCVDISFGQTLYQLIGGLDELTEFASRLERQDGQLDVVSTLSSTTNTDNEFTIFAPSNDAFANIPPDDRRNRETDSEWNKIFQMHIVPGKYTTEDMGNKEHTSLEGNAVFFRSFEGEYFVNGGRIVRQDINAPNGVLHVIDRVFDNNYVASETAYGYIEEGLRRTSSESPFIMYRNWAGILESRPSSSNPRLQLNTAKVTAFVPYDDVFGNNGNEQWSFVRTELGNQESLMTRTLESHVISSNVIESVYHYGVLMKAAESNQQLPAMEGNIRLRLHDGHLYVENLCGAHIVKEDITVNNGVIHIINNILGYQPDDAFGYINKNERTRDMRDHINKAPRLKSRLVWDGGPTVTVPNGDKVTVFAPIDQSFTNARITENSEEFWEELLQMHVVPEVLDTIDISELTTGRPTLHTGRPIKFFSIETFPNGMNRDPVIETYAEVDFVRARIVETNLCVQNGLVHFIDGVLGVPTGTVMQELSNNFETTRFYRLISDAGMTNMLQNEVVTVFAPTDEAIENMRDGIYGQQILDAAKLDSLRNLVLRHVVQNEEIYLEEGDSRDIRTGSGSFSAYYEAPGFKITYGDKTINIVSVNQRKGNGVIHMLDSVIYEETPREVEQLASSAELLKCMAPLSLLTLLCASQMLLL